MQRLINAMKGHAAAMDGQAPQPRFAVVTSFDPVLYLAKVQYQPSDAPGDTPAVSGWLPVMAPMVGNGWGMVSPPAPGMQVLVVPETGDHNSGVVVGATWSAVDAPPQTPVATGAGKTPVVPGEVAFVSEAGAMIRLGANGRIYMQDASGVSMDFQNNGTVLLTGTLRVTGDIIDQIGTNAHSIANMRAIYDTHTHGGVQSGSSHTADPDQQM